MLKNRLVPCLGPGTFISIRREEEDGIFRERIARYPRKSMEHAMEHIVHKMWTTTCCGCAMRHAKINHPESSRECLERISQLIDISIVFRPIFAAQNP